MSQETSSGFRPLRQGEGPRPRRPKPGLPPTVRHDPDRAKQSLRDWRGFGWIVTLGLICALGPFVSGWVEQAVTALEGEGYVRWRYPAWKAKAAAEKLEVPLVIVRADKESEAFKEFAQRVLAHPDMRAARGHAVWLRAVPPSDGVPELGIYDSGGATELSPTMPLTEVDPASLASELRDLEEQLE